MAPVPTVAPAVAAAVVVLLTGCLGSGVAVEMLATLSSFFRIGSLPAIKACRSAMPFVPPFHAFTQPRKSFASAKRLRFFHVQKAAQISGCISSWEAIVGVVTTGKPVSRSSAA